MQTVIAISEIEDDRFPMSVHPVDSLGVVICSRVCPVIHRLHCSRLHQHPEPPQCNRDQPWAQAKPDLGPNPSLRQPWEC